MKVFEKPYFVKQKERKDTHTQTHKNKQRNSILKSFISLSLLRVLIQ